jgi:hypothetical protein
MSTSLRSARVAIRSTLAVAAVTTLTATAGLVIGLPTASAAGAVGAAHASIPSKFEPTALIAIPHSHSVAVVGYGESKSHIEALAVPKGSHYVMRSFGKNVFSEGVVAASASSYWAIATNRVGRQEVLRLTGSKWVAVKLPALPAGAGFASIAASSPSNVWVAGNLPTADASSQQLLHWNGKTWALVSPGQTADIQIDAIGTSSSSNVWAVVGPEVIHFNGKAWSEPNNEQLGSVRTIDTSSASNVWFLGSDGSGTTVTHWNGKTFKALTVPGSMSGAVNSMSAAGESAWVAGYKSTSKATHQFVYRTNGAKWKLVKTPSYHVATAQSIVATSSSSAVVAVAETIGTSCTNYRGVPIVLALSASRTTSVAKGKAYQEGCG